MNTTFIKMKMVENNLTQGQLAEKIGMSQNSLSRKFLGKREFTVSEATRICKVLGIKKPGEIFFDEIVPNMQRTEQIKREE